jgi:SAND domain
MDMINMIYPQPPPPQQQQHQPQQLAELSHHAAAMVAAPKTYMELGSASANGLTNASGTRPPGMTVIANNNNGKDLSVTASVKDGVTVGQGPPPPGVAATPESILDDGGELRLEVTCGQNQAVLYTGRLQLGSKGTCILFENAWLTPNEFQYVSGRETAKDWKRSIKHHGKSLKVLIAKGILTTTPPARCDCGQCNNSPVSESAVDCSLQLNLNCSVVRK